MPTPTATAAAPAAARPSATRAFGRFALRELLGRSRHTMLWLVHDPQADRPRLLTLPRVAPPDAAALAQWEAQARLAARLSHPCLVPVLESGVHDHWPYVLCDRAAGLTLGEHFAQHPLPGHRDLAAWLCQVLEGLAFAHEAGVAHGDLQDHALLVDERGRLRVMALAVHAADAELSGKDSALGGARGMALDPAALRARRQLAAHDVLAVGILAHRWLAGRAALDEPDIGKVAERLAPQGRDTLRLPWTTPQPLSEVLRAIVNRATHPQPRQRYLVARTLLRALDGWREADALDDRGPLAVLVDRIDSVGLFPAMPGIGLTVARLARMEKQRIDEMAQHTLLDLALSFELIKRVNSAQVQSTQIAGNGPVLTVRRAIAMVGVNGVALAAGALRHWPGPLSEPHAKALKELVQRVRLAGHVAQLLRPAGYDPEVVFLVAVLQNLGRLMLAYHFPDDADQVRELMRPLPAARAEARAEAGAVPPGIHTERDGMAETDACHAVLGTDVEAMTHAVGQHWHLPAELQGMMRRLSTERPVHKPDADHDLLRATASAANEVVDALSAAQAATRLPAAFEAIAKRYGRTLDLTAKDIATAVTEARQALASGVPLVPRSAEDGAGDAVDADQDAARGAAAAASETAAPAPVGAGQGA